MAGFELGQIFSARFTDSSRIIFSVSGTINDVAFDSLEHVYDPRSKNATNLACREWLLSNVPTPYEPTENDRRNEREKIFSQTIDRMNPVWHDGLTAEQQENLATWRQQWLDYPTTSEEPDATLIEGIFT